MITKQALRWLPDNPSYPRMPCRPSECYHFVAGSAKEKENSLRTEPNFIMPSRRKCAKTNERTLWLASCRSRRRELPVSEAKRQGMRGKRRRDDASMRARAKHTQLPLHQGYPSSQSKHSRVKDAFHFIPIWSGSNSKHVYIYGNHSLRKIGFLYWLKWLDFLFAIRQTNLKKLLTQSLVISFSHNSFGNPRALKL